jgi:hypothetical protein
LGFKESAVKSPEIVVKNGFGALAPFLKIELPFIIYTYFKNKKPLKHSKLYTKIDANKTF